MARITRNERPGDLTTRRAIVQELRLVAASVRGLGLGLQADRILEAADALEPAELLPILQDLEHPRTYPTKKTVRWLAERLTIAAELIVELQADAEITGSDATLVRAKKFLEELGLIEAD